MKRVHGRAVRYCLVLVALALFAAVGASLAAKKEATPPPVAAAAGSEQGVAIVGGKTITASQLDAEAANQLMRLRAQEYDIKRRVLDDLIVQMLIENEAKARGITVEELNLREIEQKAAPVTADETKAFYEANKSRFGNKPEAEALKLIETSLAQNKIQQRRTAFLDGLREKAGVKILLEPPRIDVQITEADPVKGAKEAPVSIIEYSDFQCPFCSKVVPTLKQIESRYGDKVRIAFRDYPLQFHQNAQKAAEAGSCAQEQGKFWEMHDKMFGNQAELDVDKLKVRAAEIGLNAEAFAQCLDSGKHRQAVQKEMEQATRYGVTGTPAFFINGRPLVGAQPLEAFAQVINEELERKGIPVPPPPPPPPAPPAAAPAQPPAAPPPAVQPEK